MRCGSMCWRGRRPMRIRAGCGFVPALPLAGTNKVDRKALLQRALEQA